MKTKMVLLMCLAAILGGSADLYGAVQVYEGFGNAPDTNTTLQGYSGTSAEMGLTGTWSVTGGSQNTVSRTNYEYVDVSDGYSADTVGSRQHWWEHNNVWNVNVATRPLSGTIDLTVDGVYYMSFLSMSYRRDYAAQIGLNNGTNELMWGNAYYGNTSKGLTAYYGANGTSVTTNANGTFVTGFEVSPYQTGFYVAKLVKSNSGTTNDLTVSIKFYNFGTRTAPTNTIDSGDPASWTRVVSLTGVSAVFNTLRLKLDGASSNYPSIDEVRIGQSWADVTGFNVRLIAPFPTGAQYVPIDTNLEWSVNNGWGVDVYMSAAYTEPNAAPVMSLVEANNTSGLYDPPSDLAYNKWYYWRVDELEPNIPSPIVHTGKVWSFKTVGQDPVVNPVSPSQVVVDDGGTQSAVFSVTGANITGYQWCKIGSPDTQLTDGAKYAGTTTSTLTISNAVLADEGYYYCVVSNMVSPNTASNRDTGPGRLMTKRLVIHYPLDTVVSGVTPDVVSGFDMTLVSDGGGADFPTLVTAPDPDVKVGSGALWFDNSNAVDPNSHWGQYASAGDVDLEAMGNGFTVELWMKRGLLTDTVGLVVRRNTWASGQMMWGVEVQPGGGLYFASGNGWTAAVPTVQDEWTHVAATHDGVNTARIYVNGELKATATNVPYWGGANSPLMLAASNYNATTGLADNFYNGILDDVLFYNYVRSTTEIAQDYLAVNGGWICNRELAALPYDFDGNCMVDIGDLLLMANDWLDSNRVY